MIAVVPGYADVVDVEADTRVRADAGLEIGDADRYVIDAGENERASSLGAGAEDSICGAVRVARKRILSITKEDRPMNMPGIEFLRDRKGRRKAVLIDLKKHKRLWEDLYDAYLAHSRRGERRESLALVKRLVEARAKRRTRG